MSSIDNEREKLFQAVRKYKLDMPISAQGKSDALVSKRRVYVGILKKLGKYSSYMGIVIFLQYLVKKTGITLALNKTIVIVALTASTATGVYYTSEYVKHLDNQITGIKNSPSEIILTEQVRKSEIMVFASLKNGTRKNITNETHISVEPKDMLGIDKKEDRIIVTAEKNGTAIITVVYKDHQDIVRVISKLKQKEIKKTFKITERIYLKDGNVLKGRLTKDKDFYVLITPGNKIRVHKDEVEKIEYIK